MVKNFLDFFIFHLNFFPAIHELRLKSNGDSLPSPRLISNAFRTLHSPQIFPTTENLNNNFLLFYMKIVIFDIAKTLKAQTSAANFGFECCESNGRAKLSPRFANHHCAPIEIPGNDGIHRGEKCMNYIRSMVTHDGCKIEEAKIVRFSSFQIFVDFLILVKFSFSFYGHEFHLHPRNN